MDHWRYGNTPRELHTLNRCNILQGELSADSLYASAVERLGDAEAELRARPRRLREFGDYCYLQSWLLSVRGVDLQHTTLRMAEPPLVK